MVIVCEVWMCELFSLDKKCDFTRILDSLNSKIHWIYLNKQCGFNWCGHIG